MHNETQNLEPESRSWGPSGQRKCHFQAPSHLPCRGAKTVISEFNWFKSALMFVMLLILPESSSVVISWGLVAGDCLAVKQDIVWDLRDEGQAILRDDLQFQSSLTPIAAHYVGSHDPSWPIRGQYSGQSEASITAIQRPRPPSSGSSDQRKSSQRKTALH